MHRLILDVNDNVMDKIIYFLNHLPKKDVKIVQDKVIDTQNSASNIIDFSKYDVEAFRGIGDPVSWQKDQRSEWDR